MVQHQKALHEHVKAACTEGLKDMLAELISGEYTFTLQNLRQSARNFTGTELEKELQTLTIMDPYGKPRVMPFGLRPGTFEHLTLENLAVVAMFLRNNAHSKATL